MIQKSASAYERHQTILQILESVESVRVVDLANRLNVSESTIRTDLETLDAQGQLIRVRGGAVPREASNDRLHPIGQRLQHHYHQKSWLGRWAASMIEDGDTIMLDASSTVMHIAHYLTDRRGLVVFTNGVQVAQMLAKEPSNTVILVGGILRADGNALTGNISQAVLQDYHIRRAFVSCAGFLPSVGFFESDMQEAHIKTLMLKATQQRIVLLDASKVGQVGLTTFAALDDVDYVAIDTGVTVQTVEEVRATGTHVIVCGEQTSRRYAPYTPTPDVRRIGFANLSEHTSFSRDVRRGLEDAARKMGGVELVLADNQLDAAIALGVADHLLTQELDLVIEYQIDEATGNLIAHKFQEAQIPVIAVDIPMVGATYFGVDNYAAGKIAGLELGKAIQRDWGGTFDTLLVVTQERTGKLPAMRIQGQLEGLAEMLGAIPDDQIVRVDFDNTAEGAYAVIKDVMRDTSKTARIAMVCFNDDAAVGALQAAQDCACADRVRIVGQGADRRLRLEMRKAGGVIVGATAFSPERYGEHLLRIAYDILDGRQVSPAVYTKHFFVSPANVDEYYPADGEESN